ncbi:TPA: DUF1317 family protein [Yersinia enterocolitica]|uniref:DUF1317 family protein n=1 Tax=Yersinia enterocolitica TaxID=630 RepID=UPI000901669B|nr:DUF1317 family protein [Yersinia enterocolitica]HDL6989436.1 DUF1317 family protein [Yersinia enterocolitica]
MTTPYDHIKVGSITLIYSRSHRGWITPYNEVIKNPLKAQRTGSLTPPHYRQSIF